MSVSRKEQSFHLECENRLQVNSLRIQGEFCWCSYVSAVHCCSAAILNSFRLLKPLKKKESL